MAIRSTVGPGGGGAMYSTAISPHDPRLMFVACDMGGLYRSHDQPPLAAGTLWQLVDGRELETRLTIDRTWPPDRWMPPNRVAFHPGAGQGNLVFASSELRGLRLSTQHGRSGTWTTVPTGKSASGQTWPDTYLTALAVDSGGRLFVGTRNGVHYHDPPWTGAGWNACIGTGGGEVAAFVFLTDPASGQPLHFLATRGTEGGASGSVFRSLTSGASWQDVGSTLPQSWQNPLTGALQRRIDAFAGGAWTHAMPQTVLYVALPARDSAGVYEGGVLRSEDLGTSWTSAMGAGIDKTLAPRVTQYMCVGVSADAPHTVYATGWPRSGDLASFAVYKTSDRGLNWMPNFTRPLDAHPPASNVDGAWLDWDRAGFGGPPSSLTARGGTAACCNLGALYVTENGGTNWRSAYTEYAGTAAPAAGERWSSVGLEVTTVWEYRIDPKSPNRHYIAATDIGFARSDDAGERWRYDYIRNWPWADNFYELELDPAQASHLWGATSNQHDIPFEKELKVPPKQGGVVHSTDFGVNWAVKSTGLPAKPAVSLVLDPTSPAANRRLWVSMFGDGVWETTNGGTSWAKVAEPNPNNPNVYRLHRHDDGTLFCTVTGKWDAATQQFLLESALYRSTNGGQSWTAITRAPHSNPDLPLKYARDYAVSRTNSGLIYLCTGGVKGFDGDVWKTTNQGGTWTRVLTLGKLPPYLPALHAFAAFFDPRDPSDETVYVTTSTHGLWVTSDGGASWEELRGLPFLNVQRVTFDEQNPGAVFYTTHGAGVWSPADVYLRDSVGDTGDPHGGMISMSPDVIVRASPVASPQAAFGQGSGTENDIMLSDDVEFGQDNYVYVRVLNRGRPAAKDTTATVYWSEPATLLTPNMWSPIGSTELASVPAGNALTVTDAITWPAAQVPAAGHYCFVAVIGNDLDPAPPLSGFADWDAYMRFIRRQNNVTWRNFNVVDVVPAAPKAIELPFIVAGAPEEDLAMDVEILADDFPQGGRLWLEMPWRVFEAVEAQFAGVEVDPDRRAARVPVEGRKLTIEDLELRAGSRAQMRLVVAAPQKPLRKAHDVVARQLFSGIEVGRITWRLRRPRRAGRLRSALARAFPWWQRVQLGR